MVELLAVLVTIAVLAALLVPALQSARDRVAAIVCRSHLRQWGVGTHLYASDHDDFLPPEGFPVPTLRSTNTGWYVALPTVLGIPPYHRYAWRTNPHAPLTGSLFLCPANRRRTTNNNLFHYCLNGRVDGVGENDRPTRLGNVKAPQRIAWIFDNGKRAAVAQQNNVHTNLHQGGAQLLFLDGHVTQFRNSEYWDFKANKGRTNHPEIVWIP